MPVTQGFSTVTIQHERALAPRQARISTAVKAAIDDMVFTGAKRGDASTKAGITNHTLYVALKQPHVLAYMNSQMGVLRSSAIARTIAKAEDLMDGAESEHVRLGAIQYLNPPIARTENTHVHQHLIPGLTIVHGAYAQREDAQILDVTPRQQPEVRRIGTPIGHPAKATAKR